MDPEVIRDDMVDGLAHEAKGAVRSDQVAAAMRAVPREAFVEADAERAYLDQPLQHRGTRVLAPSLVARLVEALEPERGDDVLLVGAGVGYTAAVLAEVVGARHVHAVDIDRELVLEARGNLRQTGYEAALVDHGDGAGGLPSYAPYDRILVEAAVASRPRALVDQLAADGRLVFPRGTGVQTLVAVEGESVVAELGPVEFAPLLVDGEQTGAVERNRAAREERERSARRLASRTGWEHDWIDWK